MNSLIQSFTTQRNKIQRNGCCVVEGKDGWYHTYKKTVVWKRVAEIDAQIAELQQRLEASR